MPLLRALRSAPSSPRGSFAVPHSFLSAFFSSSTGRIEHPLRSVLYVPADNVKALAKASSLPCDAILIDLEDGCRDKSAGRANAATALRSNDFGSKKVVLRVNGKASPWEKDDAAIAASLFFSCPNLRAIALPKVESVRDLAVLEDAFGSPVQPFPLWAVIETPRGVLNLPRFCEESVARSPQSWKLEALVAGTSDLTKDLKARHTPGRAAMLFSLSKIVLTARAFGLIALDGVHLELSGSPEALEDYRQSCIQGRDLGEDCFATASDGC